MIFIVILFNLKEINYDNLSRHGNEYFFLNLDHVHVFKSF